MSKWQNGMYHHTHTHTTVSKGFNVLFLWHHKLYIDTLFLSLKLFIWCLETCYLVRRFNKRTYRRNNAPKIRFSIGSECFKITWNYSYFIIGTEEFTLRRDEVKTMWVEVGTSGPLHFTHIEYELQHVVWSKICINISLCM